MRLFYSLVRQYLFWMVFFALLRAMFLIYNIPLLKVEGIHWNEAAASFRHALLLDTATSCYILIIPLLLLFMQGLLELPLINRINKIYTLLIILLSTLISTVELGIYTEWKTKLTGKALAHLKRPLEVYESVSAWQFFGFLSLVILLTWLGYFMYRKIFFSPVNQSLRNKSLPIVFFITGGALLFIGLRGGVGPIPITSAASYYSEHSLLNWASMNSNYNLSVSIIEGRRYNDTNPFGFFPEEEAQAIIDRLNAVEKDTTVSVLKVATPNIVILLMESWSADLIESLGGEPGITPEFKKLEKEGLLFSQFYASGNRSPQGLASILGGFPAIPYTTLTENPDKFQKLPSLTRMLMDQGYQTSFYFGGDLDYGNIRAYLLFNGIQKIVEEKDIPGDLPRGRLGIHDEYMMQLHAEELRDHVEPFFSVLFTLSSHSPYDQPKEHSIDWPGQEEQYINSAFYSDYSLGRYFDLVRKESWYDSTLFIIIADHSHNTYRNWPLESFNYRKIPMLMLGGALKDEYRGRQVERLSSSTDFPATILNQLGLSSEQFIYSRDLFNPYSPEYAYFEFNGGLGWKVHNGEFIYNTRFDQYLYIGMHDNTTQADQDNMIRDGKAFFQVLFQAFIDM
jgi:phosphoglycerol transferase MdoB-like AlkP superfamily enzyme